MMEELAIIAAVAEDSGVIGVSGSLPWYFPCELKFFRRMTWGHSVIMGRRTMESIPDFPLSGRRNIVLSKTISEVELVEGVEFYSDFGDALSAARQTDRCPFVIGGESLYRLALPLATVLYLTFIEGDFFGDTYFPPIDRGKWEVEILEYSPPLRFTKWRRRSCL